MVHLSEVVCYSLIQSFSQWPFSSKPSKHHYTQTVTARELKFWENVHPSRHVRCLVSRVRYNVYLFLYFFWQNGGPSRWRVCYQQGLQHLYETNRINRGYTKSLRIFFGRHFYSLMAFWSQRIMVLSFH